MNYSRSNHKHKTRAQAMVEFALALPLLLLLVFGLMETGRLLFIYASTVSAAREAVRYGSAMGKNASNVSYYQDCAGIKKAAQNVGFINKFNDADILITFDGGLDDNTGIVIPLSPANPSCGSFSSIKNGDRIKVSVSTQWLPIVSIVPLTPFTITSSSERTVIKSIPISQAIPGATAPAAPQLVSPTEGAFLDPGSVTFTWSATSGATEYWFEYSGAASGNSGWINGTSFSVTLSNGTYSWHVKARNINGESPWGSTPPRSLNIATAPAAPTLVSPVDGGTATPGTISFIWNISNGASEYYFEYSSSSSFSSILGNSGWIASTSHPVSLDEGTYYWHVKAKNVMGESGYSAIDSLIVKAVPQYLIILGVSPTSQNTTPKAGDLIPFTYTISNLGSQQVTGISLTPGSDLTGITLDMASCPNPITLNVGQNKSCNANRVVTQTEIDAGTPLNNNWVAHGTLAPSTVTIPTTITIQQTKSILISDLTGSLSTDGNKITTTYTIQNTGNVTLQNIAVTDTRGTVITCPTGALIPSAKLICIGDTTLTSAEKTAGTIQVVGTATDGGKAVSASITKTFLSVLPVCAGTKLVTLSGPTLSDSNKVHTYTITNTTTAALNIKSISFVWVSSNQSDQVKSIKINNVDILSGNINSSPLSISGTWAIPINTSSLVITFQNNTPAVTNLQITFSEAGCHIP